ncbi:MAG: hypothetical protein DCC75_04625 [Proteobacteria bacterium]|nr:MAG: hypothetical protein DCC75_04625 [Pseudomonadota bacterium]
MIMLISVSVLILYCGQKSSRMRILSLYYTHKPGGFCKRLYRLLNALSKAGHEVHYLALDPPPANLSPQIRFVRIPFLMQSRSGILFWLIFSIWLPFYLVLHVLRIKPERYVVFGTYYSAALVLAKLFVPASIVLFIRTLLIPRVKSTQRIKQELIALGDKIGLRLASKIICQTVTMKEQVIAIYPSSTDKIEILPNDAPRTDLRSMGPDEGVKELLSERGAGEDALICLTSGVFVEGKNISLLLKAFTQLHSKHGMRYVLLIAGQGRALEQCLHEHSPLPANIIHLGWRSGIADIFPLVSLVLHPSTHEGMPNSVLEPLGAGIPVLVGRTPEALELVGDERLTFSTENPEELAVRLENLSQEVENIRKLCRRRGEELSFDWDAVAVKATVC